MSLSDPDLSPAPGTPGRKRGDVAEATVESLDYESRGVARIDGKTTFIDGALPGETVRFRYLNKHKRYDVGRTLEVLVPSPDRIEPRCPHFGVCGGCSLQHMRSAAQLQAKQEVLRDTLTHVGNVTPESWMEPLSAEPWGYRRRARLGVKLVPKKGGVLVGFRERNSAFITPLSRCDVLVPGVAALLPAMRDLVAGLSCPDRLPQIEVSVGDDATAMIFRHLDLLTTEDLAALRAFGEQHGVQIWLQAKGPETIAPLWPEAPAPLVYRLPEFDLAFTFAATDFIQVNAELNKKMVHQALVLLDPQPQDHVLDLFCGLGNFTLPLARCAGHVLGMEGDARLIDKARFNAGENGIGNAGFQVVNLHDESALDFLDTARFDKWLMDPPRTGAFEIVKRLPLSHAPKRIVYVSCNPATLARDAEVLVNQKGYRLLQAGAMDMFPQTTHVEAIAVFERG